MTNTLSNKFTALALALLMNGAMAGSVAYLFDGRLHGSSAVIALASTTGSLDNGDPAATAAI